MMFEIIHSIGIVIYLSVHIYDLIMDLSCQNSHPHNICCSHQIIQIPLSVICFGYLIFNFWTIFVAIKAKYEIESYLKEDKLSLTQDVIELEEVKNQ